MRPAVARARRRLSGVPVPLRLILAVAALEVLCWVSFAPPWQGPDESAHFAYAQHYAEIGDPPVRFFPKIGAGSVSTQQGSAEVWFNLRAIVGDNRARPLATKLDRTAWERTERTIPKLQREDGYGPNSQAQNPAAYYIYETVPYKVVGGEHILTAAFWMRLWSGLLFLFAVAFTWLAAGELFGLRRGLQALAASCVALLPQLAYMGSIVNADVALTAIWSAFTWLSLRLLKRGPAPATILPLALTVALSVVTHGRGLALVVPGVVVVIVAFARRRERRLVPLVAAVASVGLVAAAVVWAFHATHSSGGAAYGGEARFVAGGFSVKGFLNYVWQFYFPRLPWMGARLGPEYGFRDVFIYTFFGAFGSLEVGFPSWVYRLLHTGTLVGLFALLAALWHQRASVWRSWDVLVVLAAMVGALLFVLHFVAYRDMLGQPGDPVLVGRYVLPLIAVWALGIATIAAALPPKWATWFGAGIACVGVLMQIAGLGLIVTRFYG